MSSFLSLLQLVGSLLFVLVGVAAGARWLRDRRAASGWLALVIGSLAVTSILGRVSPLADGLRPLVADVSVVALMVSGYAMLRFRGAFIPLSERVQLAVAVGAAVICLLAIAARVGDTAQPTPLQAAVTVVLVLAWVACLADPLVRFAMASMTVPAVQRSRLLSLATAFAALAMVVLANVLAPTIARRVEFQVGTQLVALATIPLIYFSFAPPRWLRAVWRGPEEEALRAGMRQLLLFSPSRKVLAERALEGAMRLVGGDGALIVDGEGHALAARGISTERVESLLRDLSSDDPPSIVPIRQRDREAASAVIVPLTLSNGTGALIVTSGPFTPYFGADELERLRGFATSISAGLDRTVLTERLAALERAKSEFLNLASHELRGPITLLRGYLSMISTGSLGEFNPQIEAALPVMEQKAEEMNALVEQMIEAARLEEGRLELHPVDADLRELVERAVQMIRPLASRTHELVVEQPLEEVRATVDPDRVGTILGNLLSNAIKYSPAGGQVLCRVRRNGAYGVISVSDRGIGIPTEMMDKLFTRFGRLVTRETEHIGGTGLGLYLSRELARLHGGDVTVESELGLGSTFSLRLPLAG